jgi:arylsulfatase A-like enzyme
VLVAFPGAFLLWHWYASRPLLGGANVLMILVDTLRADHLGCYGHPRETSPFLDEFAGESVLFENVTSASSQTVPSMISIWSGVYPRQHGNQYFDQTRSFREPRRGVPPKVPDDTRLMAESFRERGYRTGAVVTNPWMRAEYGFSRGFEEYEYLPEVVKGVYPRGSEVNRVGIDLLRRWREEPFFLYLHYMDVHAPYQPREPYRTQFAGPANGRRVLSWNGPLPQALPRDVEYTHAHYDAEIRGLDDHVRELMLALQSLGLESSTLVIFASDHGEEFHEHGGMGHGSTLYEEVVHVPLLIVHPEIPPRRVAEPVSSLDLLPTVIDLIGLDGRADPIDGTSLTGLMIGDAGAGSRPGARPLFSELGAVKAIRRGGQKVIQWLAKPRLDAFDVTLDPEERHAVVEGAWRDELANELSRFLAEGRRGAGLEKPGRDEVVDPETSERLRMLGYGD